jgi:hypothetical protein
MICCLPTLDHDERMRSLLNLGQGEIVPLELKISRHAALKKLAFKIQLDTSLPHMSSESWEPAHETASSGGRVERPPRSCCNILFSTSVSQMRFHSEETIRSLRVISAV